MRALCMALILALSVAQAVQGAETGHYPPAAEGIKAATVPPPGLWLKTYFIYYRADRLNDNDGHNTHTDTDIRALVACPRLIWMTDKKFLGADYGMDIAAAVIQADVEIDAAGVDDRHTGVGDILIEPLLLGWHTDRWDVGAAIGWWAPTGRWDEDDPAAPGKDFWTTMLTFGATYYLDEQKTWSASALGRYETHTKKRRTRVRPGDDFHVEWGLAKKLSDSWEVGLVGYNHWQVTDDAGGDVGWNKNHHDRFCAMGPEIVYWNVDSKLAVSLRYEREFAVHDRSQGHHAVLSVLTWF